jgi:peptide/nickel transport system substrate-binding protein
MFSRFAPCLFWICVVLAACSPASEDGQVLRVGIGLEPPHLDPTASAAAAIDEVVYANLFEGLTRINAEGEIVPGLASSWSVSDDGLTYRFELRQGVQFHDGTVFNARIVEFTIDRARAEGSTNPRPDIFAPIESVSAPSPFDVEIRLSRPSSNFLFNLAQGDAVMVAPDSAHTNTQTPIGTGPFRFARWQKGQQLVLERNLAYWGEPTYLDGVRFSIIPDSAAAYAALLAGDIDGFANFPAPELVGQLSRDPRFRIVLGFTEGETVLGLNAREALFDDIRVRQAIGHAIDRGAIIEGAMYGFGTEIGSFFSPLHPAYLDLTDRSDFDPDRARALLVEAGFGDGLQVELKLPPTNYARRSGEIIAAQLKEIGVDVQLQYVEWASWLDQVLTRHVYDMTIVAHTEPNDLSFFAREINYFGYLNPDFNSILDQIEITTDPDERAALYRQAQIQLADDAAAVFLFQLPQLGIWRADLEGVWQNAPIQAIDVTQVRFITDEAQE